MSNLGADYPFRPHVWHQSVFVDADSESSANRSDSTRNRFATRQDNDYKQEFAWSKSAMGGLQQVE
ncbi:hypothetical protein DMH04_25500 [Kibdelosporangium aridum]|uniref:Uncharacterized protein n=1 Tax=Kibdelosporangium aridum TaxID=2030 RepID=A0A428Z686_KIBAR|nr:hypothetical protein DMH04_25500 [Kibdelosporangium aridum]